MKTASIVAPIGSVVVPEGQPRLGSFDLPKNTHTMNRATTKQGRMH